MVKILSIFEKTLQFGKEARMAKNKIEKFSAISFTDWDIIKSELYLSGLWIGVSSEEDDEGVGDFPESHLGANPGALVWRASLDSDDAGPTVEGPDDNLEGNFVQGIW